jgi:hypothetical protein
MHGAQLSEDRYPEGSETAAPDFTSLYVAYAESTLEASRALREHGKASRQFAVADVASMRLFHRVKKAQGLKKPKSG